MTVCKNDYDIRNLPLHRLMWTAINTIETSPVLLEEPELLPPSREEYECGVAISVPAVYSMSHAHARGAHARARTAPYYCACARYISLRLHICTCIQSVDNIKS